MNILRLNISTIKDEATVRMLQFASDASITGFHRCKVEVVGGSVHSLNNNSSWQSSTGSPAIDCIVEGL